MSSLKNDKNLSAFDGAGAESAPAPTTGLVTLSIDSHYFEVPVTDEGEIQSIHILTDDTIAGTFTIEAANFPQAGPAGAVSTWNETAGNWVPLNVAAVGYAQGVGTGWTITVLSLAKTAGAGGAMINLSALGVRRLRLKAAISTGGTVRVSAHGTG